jgi:oligopeptide transport system substrate-binding protein
MRLIAAALFLLFFTLSCDREEQQQTNTFRFINRGDIYTLDLNQMSYGQDFRVTYAIREGLYSPTGPGFSAEPAGATHLDLSEDKRVYTFHLRRDAKWSNGDAVTAEDYAFSWRYMLQSPGEYTSLLYNIHNSEPYQKAYLAGKPIPWDEVGVKVIDPFTLQVTLDLPMTYFIDIMAFPNFYPRHAASMKKHLRVIDGREIYDTAYTRPPDIVTNGPFMLVKWDFKSLLRMERNPHYWDRANVKLDALENVVNNNTLSQFLQYEAGAIDYILDVPGEIAPDVYESKRPDLKTAQAFGTAFLTLYTQPNFKNEVLGGAKNPLADVRVRQALSMAIDRKFITEQITRLGEQPAQHYIPPGTLDGYTNLPGLPEDVQRAKELLAEAGYPNGEGFPKLPIVYNTENAVRAKIVQALKQQWKQSLNIDVEIEGVEGKIFSSRVTKRAYAIATVSWYGDYSDVSTFTDKYRSNGTQNDAAYFSKEYDAYLDAAAREGDPVKRMPLLQKAEQLLNTEVPIIPMYHYVNCSLIRDRVKGITINSRHMIDWKKVSLEARK